MGEMMIGVFTHHWAKIDNLKQARDVLNGNGIAQSKASGFVGRQTFISHSDSYKITTVVIWETNELYDAWRSSPERAAAMLGAEQFWASPPESERFELIT